MKQTERVPPCQNPKEKGNIHFRLLCFSERPLLAFRVGWCSPLYAVGFHHHLTCPPNVPRQILSVPCQQQHPPLQPGPPAETPVTFCLVPFALFGEHTWFPPRQPGSAGTSVAPEAALNQCWTRTWWLHSPPPLPLRCNDSKGMSCSPRVPCSHLSPRW